MSDQAHPSQSPLTSWKEIAAHFQKDVRTVQRWEREEGLPVHRHLHHHQASVYAYANELDRWWRARDGCRRGSVPPAVPEVIAPTASPDLRRSYVLTAVLVVSVTALAALTAWPRSGNNESALVPQVVAADDPTYWFDGAAGELIPAVPGDLDRDGQTDLVFAAWAGREVYVILGRAPRARGAVRDVATVRIAIRDNGGLSAFGPGDINGDGFPDLLVAVNLYEPDAYGSTGPTYVLFGRRTWPSRLTLPDDADVTFGVDLRKDIRLSACPGVVDLDRDGIADVVLGGGDFSPGDRTSAGAAFVFFGRSNWPARLDAVKNADVTIAGARKGDGLTAACASGDWNGDGLSDLALLATESQLWNLLGGRGRVYLFAGRRVWPALLHTESDFTLRVDGSRPAAVHTEPLMADVNGDGLRDLVVAAAGTFTPPHHGGHVSIWFGASGKAGVLSDQTADVSIEEPLVDAGFGASTLAGDVDRDGLDDVIVSEPGTGRIYLFYGRREWKKRGTPAEMGGVTISTGRPGAGTSRMAVGDIDGDGLIELIATSAARGGAPKDHAARAWTMRIYERVTMDVRPEVQPNVIVYPAGTLAVRLSGAREDGDEIDPATLRAAGAAVSDYVWRDFDQDGRKELQVYFETKALRIDAGTRALLMTGRTRSGRPLAGTDAVVVYRATDDARASVKPASATARPPASSLR